MSYKKIDELIKLEKKLSYDNFKENDFRAFLPLLNECVILEGNGDENDSGTHFVCVVASDSVENKELAIIASTYSSARGITREIQNLEVLLKNKYQFARVERQIVTKDTITSLLSDGRTYKEETNERQSSNYQATNNDTKTLTSFKSYIVKGLNLKASDIDVVVKDNERAWIKYKVDGRWSHETPVAAQLAKNMVSAALQTKSKDFDGQDDENRILDVTINLDVEVRNQADKSAKLVSVGLRGHKTYNHDGFMLTARIMLLGKHSNIQLDALGFDDKLTEDLREIMENPYGVFLVVAPTNSGKTTTLVALYETVEQDRKIVLIEDPVETLVNHPNCYQRSPKDKDNCRLKDLLKDTLRQSPEIVGVSEVRNEEVASAIMGQALTGSLMVSTLHSVNAISAIERMIQLEVSPKTLAEENGLKGVFAQRLVPVLCPDCKIPHDHKIFGASYRRNKSGCASCDDTGFKGRKVVGEFLKVDDDIRGIIQQEDYPRLRQHLKDKGWQSMSDRLIPDIQNGTICPDVAHMTVGNINIDSNKKFKTVHPQADVSTELLSKPETDIKNVNSEIQNDIHHEQVVAV